MRVAALLLATTLLFACKNQDVPGPGGPAVEPVPTKPAVDPKPLTDPSPVVDPPAVDPVPAASGSCKSDGDCRSFSDYCKGCDCRVLGPGEHEPKCDGPGVRCLVDPCTRFTPACVAGKCTLQEKAKDAPTK